MLILREYRFWQIINSCQYKTKEMLLLFCRINCYHIFYFPRPYKSLPDALLCYNSDMPYVTDRCHYFNTLTYKNITDKICTDKKNTDKKVHARGPSVRFLSVQFFSVCSNNCHGLQN